MGLCLCVTRKRAARKSYWHLQDLEAPCRRPVALTSPAMCAVMFLSSLIPRSLSRRVIYGFALVSLSWLCFSISSMNKTKKGRSGRRRKKLYQEVESPKLLFLPPPRAIAISMERRRMKAEKLHHEHAVFFLFYFAFNLRYSERASEEV